MWMLISGAATQITSFTGGNSKAETFKRATWVCEGGWRLRANEQFVGWWEATAAVSSNDPSQRWRKPRERGFKNGKVIEEDFSRDLQTEEESHTSWEARSDIIQVSIASSWLWWWNEFTIHLTIILSFYREKMSFFTHPPTMIPVVQEIGRASCRERV